MTGDQPDRDGLGAVLEEVRKNIRDNELFLELLKNDRDVEPPENDEKHGHNSDDFEEL